jgi:hypothetical protein
MTRRLVMFLLGLAGTLLLLELLLRLLPVSTASQTGYHQHPEILSVPAGHRWTVSTGWDLRNPQRLVANAQGFVAERDFVRDPAAVGLIGDSYVEASMLDAPDRPGAQLERALGAPVYAMGTPGTALLDYGVRLRWASEQFGLRRFVLLLERGDAVQSLCGSGNVVSRCLDAQTLQPRRELQPPPSAAKRVLRHSALAQYLASQIRVDARAFLRSVFTRNVPGEGVETAKPAAAAPSAEAVRLAHRRTDAVLDAFFADLPQDIDLLVVLDGARQAPWLADSDGRFERAHLIHELRRRGARVIDLQPVFQRHVAADPRSLEVGPYDGHLNRLGVALAMQAAARELQR